MMKRTGLLGVFTKTHSSKLPVTGFGYKFQEVLNEIFEFLNPKDWDYSDFKRYVPKDKVIEQAFIYNQQDLEIIYKYLVKEAHQQMDFLQKNPPQLSPNYITHSVKIEIEGKQLEMNFFAREVKRLWSFSKQIEQVSEEIKLEGALGILFYPKKISKFKI